MDGNAFGCNEMNYEELTDEQANTLYDYLRNQLRSLNPGVLKRIQKELDDCQYIEDQLDLVSNAIEEETRKLKSLRDNYANQLMSQYPDAYADIEDLLEGDDYMTQIETLKDIIANEESQQRSLPQPQQHTPIMFNDSETHMTQLPPPPPQTKRIIPQWDDSLESLTRLRDANLQTLTNANVPTKDFQEVLNNAALFRQNMPASFGKKKGKTNKYGTDATAMANLQNIVLQLKQDIKQIKDAQIVDANDVNDNR